MCIPVNIKPAIGFQLVTAAGMQALHSLFAASPKPECLSAPLNAQIINVSTGHFLFVCHSLMKFMLAKIMLLLLFTRLFFLLKHY